MADRDLDPRFDPRYQRGFDPALHETPDDRDAPRSSLSRPTALAQASTPAPLYQGEAAAPYAGPPGLERAAVLDELDPRDADEPDDLDSDDELERSRLNPFRLALLLVSLAALVAASALFGMLVTSYSTGFSSDTFTQIFFYQVASTAPAPLISGGILGIVLWIASGAFLGGGSRGE